MPKFTDEELLSKIQFPNAFSQVVVAMSLALYFDRRGESWKDLWEKQEEIIMDEAGVKEVDDLLEPCALYIISALKKMSLDAPPSTEELTEVH